MFYSSTGNVHLAFRFFHTKANRKRQRTTQCIVLRRQSGDTPTLLYSGLAVCSKRDNFNKETGRKLALTRAIERLSREERAAIWSTYLDRQNPLVTQRHLAAVQEFKQLTEATNVR